MTPKLVYYFFMERLEQEIVQSKQTPESRAEAEISSLIKKETMRTKHPVQIAIKNMTFTTEGKKACIANLDTIGYDKSSLDASDFYLKKALLLEAIKQKEKNTGKEQVGKAQISEKDSKEDYSYEAISKLIKIFDTGGVRGTSANQRRLIQFYLYQNGFYPLDYITNNKISLFDVCDGIVGPNTKLAIDNFKKRKDVSASVVANLEGNMTSDSIRKPSAIPSQVAVVPQQMDMPSTEQSNAVKTSSTETIAHPNVWSARLGKLCDQYVKAAGRQSEYNDVRNKLGLVSGMFYENAKNNFAGIEKGGTTMGKNAEYKRYLNYLEDMIGIQKNFLYAMMIVESKGNSGARNTQNNSDCRGLFQLNKGDFGAFLGNPIMEAIAAAMTVRFGYYNPSCNIVGAHDIAGILTRYNYGGKRQVMSHYGLDFEQYARLNPTTKQHIAKVYYVMAGLSDTPQANAMRDFTEQLLQAGGYSSSIFDNTFGKTADQFAKFCIGTRRNISDKYAAFEPKEMTRMHTAWEKYRYNINNNTNRGFQFDRDVVFVGDSITQGYSSYHQMNASFSVQGKTSDVICGHYTDQAIQTIQKYRALDLTRGATVKKLVLMCGTNDLMGNPDIAHIVSSNVGAFVQKCKAKNIQPVLCTLPISPTIATKVEAYNAELRMYAQQNNIQLIEFGGIKNVPAGNNRSAVNRFETGKVRVHPLPGTYKEMAQTVKQQLS